MTLPARFRNLLTGISLIHLAGMVLLAGSASVAKADSFTQYSYTGSTFANSFLNSCPPTCSITGSFIVTNPLAGKLNNATIAPISYSFSDGLATFTQANSSILNFDFFSTNGSGAITQWDIFLGSLDGNKLLASTTEGSFIDLTTDFVTGAESDSEKKGKWSSKRVSASVPEPSVLFLLLAGLLLASRWVSKQKFSLQGSIE